MAQAELPLGFTDHVGLMSPERALSPEGYTGLYSFHKYWGKKPYEPIAFVIERLTRPGDVVMDPFLGSGTTGREALLRRRRFLGFDINPFAVAISKLIMCPPDLASLKPALKEIERLSKGKIEESYLLADGETPATHYLWEGEELREVWIRSRRENAEQGEFSPSSHDRQLIEAYRGYKSRRIRNPRFFTNGRINASPSMSLDDLLTGRAQRNIDLLLDAIDKCPTAVQPALKLCLTAASGQMSKMVFAVTGRGKTTGKTSDKTEVGSWVIGFWRPHQHFEVNVWNCFETRTRKLLKSLSQSDPLSKTVFGNTADELLLGGADAYLACADCRSELQKLPDSSVSLVITDPPHSDRMPYLELSEFWNSILGFSVNFDREIVHSNAKERKKDKPAFNRDLFEFLSQARRVLRPDGILVLLYNARGREEWEAIRAVCAKREPLLRYLGFFMCGYSARSVVQDNRTGSLKADYALAFARPDSETSPGNAVSMLSSLPQWSSDMPEHLGIE